MSAQRFFFMAQVLIGRDDERGQFRAPEVLTYEDEELEDFMDSDKLNKLFEGWVIVQKTWSGEYLGFYAFLDQDDHEETIAATAEHIRRCFSTENGDKPTKPMRCLVY